MTKARTPQEYWEAFIAGRDPTPRWERRVLRLLPRDPRCKLCNAPFRGLGASLLRITGRGPSRKNPRFCNICERYLIKYGGGVETAMSFLFADVRGSTTLGERMTPVEFSRLLNRFYEVSNRTIIEADALVDKLVGDEVVAFFPPYLTNHARAAVTAAQQLLQVTGHDASDGPWIPIGIGVHTGRAFYGAVGSEETVSDITALGDDVNVTARLVALAGPGEILVSDAAAQAAGLDLGAAERRSLQLKGRSEPVGVYVLTAIPQVAAT